MGQNDFIKRVNDKDLASIIRGICDAISRDLNSVEGSTSVTGKRQSQQLSIFKAVARHWPQFKARSTRQFVTSAACELLLSRYKDRDAQLVVSSCLRVVLSHRPHVEHLLWDHFRRSAASLCREISGLCAPSSERNESCGNRLIQEMLLCLEKLTSQGFVGLAELKHELWNCLDSLLYKFPEVSEIHVPILQVSLSLFDIVMGQDYDVCHEMVPVFIALAPKLLQSRTREVRDHAIRFLLKMEVYLTSVMSGKCPVPLDREKTGHLNDSAHLLLEFIRQDYFAGSDRTILEDNDVAFENDDITLMNQKKSFQFNSCKLIAMLQHVLVEDVIEVKAEPDEMGIPGRYSIRVASGTNFKQLLTLGPRKKRKIRTSLSPSATTSKSIGLASAQVEAFASSKPVDDTIPKLTTLLENVSGSLDKRTRWQCFSAARLLAQTATAQFSPKNPTGVKFLAAWWREGASKLRTRAEDSACMLLTTILAHHGSSLTPKLVLSIGEHARTLGPTGFSVGSTRLVSAAMNFLVLHKSNQHSKFQLWLLDVLAAEGELERAIPLLRVEVLLECSSILLASVGVNLRTKVKVARDTLNSIVTSQLWRIVAPDTLTYDSYVSIVSSLGAPTALRPIVDLKSALQDYLSELCRAFEHESLDVGLFLCSTVMVLITSAVLDRLGVTCGLNSRISDSLALLTKHAEKKRDRQLNDQLFESMGAVAVLRRSEILGESLVILWDSFLDKIRPLICTSPSPVMTEAYVDPVVHFHSASSEYEQSELRLSLLFQMQRDASFEPDPSLLALFAPMVENFAADNIGRLQMLLRYIGQRLLSSYIWDCSQQAKGLVIGLIRVYDKASDMPHNSDVDDLRGWVLREQTLLTPVTLIGLLEISDPAEFVANPFSAVAIASSQKVPALRAYACTEFMISKSPQSPSASQLFTSAAILSFLCLHAECTDLLPSAVYQICTIASVSTSSVYSDLVLFVAQSLETTPERLLSFVWDRLVLTEKVPHSFPFSLFGYTDKEKFLSTNRAANVTRGVFFERILNLKVDGHEDIDTTENTHFSTRELLTSEDELIRWNVKKGIPLSLLRIQSREKESWSSSLLLVTVRELLDLMLSPRISFEVHLRLVQLKYVLCLFPCSVVTDFSSYTPQQLVRCLSSFVSHPSVGASVSHLLGVLFRSPIPQRVETFVGDLGEQCLLSTINSQPSGAMELLRLLNVESVCLDRYVDWCVSGYSNVESFIKVFTVLNNKSTSRADDKILSSLIRSLDFLFAHPDTEPREILGLVEMLSTSKLIGFLRTAVSLFPRYNWSKSRVLGLVLGRGHLVCQQDHLKGLLVVNDGSVDPDTAFWTSVVHECLEVLGGEVFSSHFHVERCLALIGRDVDSDFVRGGDFGDLQVVLAGIEITSPDKQLFRTAETGVVQISNPTEWLKEATTSVLVQLANKDPSYLLLAPLVQSLDSPSLSFLEFLFKWSCYEFCRLFPSEFLNTMFTQTLSARQVSSDVGRCILRTYFFVNDKSGKDSLIWDPMVVNITAMKLDQYTAALYFLEADKACWESQAVQPSYYEIYQNVQDPDLFYGLELSPSLESALKQLNHESQNQTCFEYESGLFDWKLSGGRDKDDSQRLLKSACLAGMNGLAYSLGTEEDSYRWKLCLLDDPILQTGTNDQVILSLLRSLVAGDEPLQAREYSTELVDNLLNGDPSAEKYLAMEYLFFDLLQSVDTLVPCATKQNLMMDSLSPVDGVADILMFSSSVWRSLQQVSQVEGTGTINGGIKTLAKLGSISRGNRDFQVAKNCAIALEDMIQTSLRLVTDSGIAAALKNHATMEIACCLWDEVNVSRTTPVSMLTKMMKSLDPSTSSTFAEQMCQASVLLTDWSSQARMLSPEEIRQTYIMGVYDRMSLIPSGEIKSSMFHVFGKFCERQFESEQLAERIASFRLDVDRLDQEIAGLQRLSTSAPQKQALRLALMHKERSLETLETSEKQQSQFLGMAVEFYLRSCAVQDTKYHEDITRLVSLWFGNSQVPAINDRIGEFVAKIPSIKMAPLINQLSSRLQYDKNDDFQGLLLDLVARLCVRHPYHCLYQIASLMRADSSPETKMRIAAAKKVWSIAKSSTPAMAAILKSVETLTDKCVDLANAAWPNDRSKVSIAQFSNGTWWQNGLRKLRIPPPIANIPFSSIPDYSTVPTMLKVSSTVVKAGGLSRPKIMEFRLSDGTSTKGLLKGGRDDMRQDAIMEQVFCRVNQYFKQDVETKRRGLSIRTYNVVPLGPQAGMIEFVLNTESLQDILIPLHAQDELNMYDARSKMKAVVKESPSSRVNALTEIYSKVHPVLSQYFFRRFRRSPEEWFEARTNYVRSAAASSILGYVLGIGDRHCNNILLDTHTGELVHIDLGISFDQGQNLTVPETVPFRLTRDMVDGMGSVGVDGPFRRCCELSLCLLRFQRDNILSILNVLRYDPLYSWTLSPLKKKEVQRLESNISAKTATSVGGADDQDANIMATRCLKGVESKLSNHLSTEAVVRELITEATSVDNLALIFQGWTPFY